MVSNNFLHSAPDLTLSFRLVRCGEILKKNQLRNSARASLRPPSKPREFHPQLLTDPDLSLSTHPARVSTLDKHSSGQKAVATFGILFEANRRT